MSTDSAQPPALPAPDDDSKAVGNNEAHAESCAVVRFYTETHQGAAPDAHNLWFHESWSGLQVPYNILFAEMNEKPIIWILPRTPKGEARKEINIPGVLPIYVPGRPRRRSPPSFFQRVFNKFRDGVDANRERLSSWLELVLAFLIPIVAIMLVVAVFVRIATMGSRSPQTRALNVHAPHINTGDHITNTGGGFADRLWGKLGYGHGSSQVSTRHEPDQPVTVRLVHTQEQFIKDDNGDVILSFSDVNQFFVILDGGENQDDILDKITGSGTRSSRKYWFW